MQAIDKISDHHCKISRLLIKYEKHVEQAYWFTFAKSGYKNFEALTLKLRQHEYVNRSNTLKTLSTDQARKSWIGRLKPEQHVLTIGKSAFTSYDTIAVLELRLEHGGK